MCKREPTLRREKSHTTRDNSLKQIIWCKAMSKVQNNLHWRSEIICYGKFGPHGSKNWTTQMFPKFWHIEYGFSMRRCNATRGWTSMPARKQACVERQNWNGSVGSQNNHTYAMKFSKIRSTSTRGVQYFIRIILLLENKLFYFQGGKKIILLFFLLK